MTQVVKFLRLLFGSSTEEPQLLIIKYLRLMITFICFCLRGHSI